MKPYIIITCLLVVSATAFSKQNERPGPKPHSHVRVISKKRDTFYFRAHQELIGGQINVVSENGDTVVTAPIMRKHALIDFFYENPGRYTIVIGKGDIAESFDFTKKTPSPYVLIEREKLTVYQ